MSTKIYEGLKFNTTDAFEAMSKIKEIIEPIYGDNFRKIHAIVEEYVEQEKTYEELNERIGLLHERNYFEPLKKDKRVRFADITTANIVKHLQNSEVRAFGDFDIGYNVIILKNSLPEENLLGFIFSDCRDYYDALIENDFVTEYGYWDNTDRPDEVTKKEWEKREQEWEDLMIPAEDGLSFKSPGTISSIGLLYF